MLFHCYNIYFIRNAHCVRLKKTDKTRNMLKRPIKTHNSMMICKLELEERRYGNTNKVYNTQQIGNKSLVVLFHFIDKKYYSSYKSKLYNHRTTLTSYQFGTYIQNMILSSSTEKGKSFSKVITTSCKR